MLTSHGTTVSRGPARSTKSSSGLGQYSLQKNLACQSSIFVWVGLYLTTVDDVNSSTVWCVICNMRNLYPIWLRVRSDLNSIKWPYLSSNTSYLPSISLVGLSNLIGRNTSFLLLRKYDFSICLITSALWTGKYCICAQHFLYLPLLICQDSVWFDKEI